MTPNGPIIIGMASFTILILASMGIYNFLDQERHNENLKLFSEILKKLDSIETNSYDIVYDEIDDVKLSPPYDPELKNDEKDLMRLVNVLLCVEDYQNSYDNTKINLEKCLSENMAVMYYKEVE